MTDHHVVRDEFARFRSHRADLQDAALSPDVRDATIAEGAMLTIGILIGGGFPGAAACVSLLMEHRFPDKLWPWSGAPA